MKRSLLLSLILSTSLTAVAQGADSSSYWKLKALYGVNGTQSSFVNWVAGGKNNVAALGYIVASARFTKNKMKWDSDLGVALGALKYVGKDAENLQKTDDRIELASSFGYKLKDDIFLSFNSGFRTQFMDGKPSTFAPRTSKFMTPGYVNLALGIDYTPNDNFTLFASPLAGKMTFVQDEDLANAGSFGVEPATYDSNTGAILALGRQFRGEFGASLKMKYAKTLVENIEMKTKLELFTNYIDRPENIDVNAEVMFTFKVNSWFSASLNWNLIYDHDILITDTDANTGPRTQFKSVLGLGVSYTMKNTKE